MKVLPIILAGGTGTRLWPLSRELYPKQLLQLTDNFSLLQNTVKRVASLDDILPPLIVVGEEHRFVTKSQMDELGLFPNLTILLEPLGRDTAPAICGAVEYARQHGCGDAVMLILPTDHLIAKVEAFRIAVKRAVDLARLGKIVTFGIKPETPETGYGYIERGEGDMVASFKEKPGVAQAVDYIQSGNYLWNSGMLAFTVATFLDEMELHAPDIAHAMEQSVRHGMRDAVFFRFDAGMMPAAPGVSIDYALMEKTDCAVVVTADLGWNDIGSWRGLWEVLEKDDAGNVCRGDVLLEGTSNCLVQAHSKLVAVVGLSNSLVIETEDAVLVAAMSQAQDVRNIVDILKGKDRKEVRYHHTVHRPWGNYTVLDEDQRFQIKRIVLLPGAALSLQKHFHRYEHWVVLSGTARITKDDEVYLLFENESTFIPEGVMHRLENPGVASLEIIEVQIGGYLGEDDIVRYDNGGQVP